jgi:hypothetical protein
MAGFHATILEGFALSHDEPAGKIEKYFVRAMVGCINDVCLETFMPETATYDHYEVLTRDDGSLYELGRGAMGVTYKAFDTRLRFPVCLKVINSAYLNSEVARQRFIREARSAASCGIGMWPRYFTLGLREIRGFTRWSSSMGKPSRR